MNLKKLLIIVFVIVVIILIPNTHSKIANTDPTEMFDTDLYESVLDPELCQKQLEYIRSNDTFLRLQFLTTGIRFPRGILKGNLMDFGNYPQCLGISKELEDTTIKGKYCTIHIPLDLDFKKRNNFNKYIMSFESQELDFHELKFVEQVNKEKSLLTKEGLNTNDGIYVTNMEIFMAVCLPQPCTTREALNGLLFNMSFIDIEYREGLCRLPNDRPFVAVDYIAWVIFGFLGLITIFSTCYDVRHTVFLKKDPKEISELLSTFSVYKNTNKLVKITKKPGTLECLDGIRALSTFWVVLGHTFALAAMLPANPVDILDWYSSVNAIWMKAAPLAVDTFFLLSGILVVYTTIRKFTTLQLAKNLHIFYLHRLLRIFPVLAAVILLKASFFHHVSDGPVWLVAAAEAQLCRHYWWITLLHLQNFLRPNRGCLGESWYLAIDMQLHILSPLVLLWLLSGAKKPKLMALIFGFLISLTAAATYIFVNDFSPEGLDHTKHFNINVLTRAPPFFVGMIFGYLLHLSRKEKIFRVPKILGYFITAFSLGMLALTLYGKHIYHHGDISQGFTDFLLAFKRTCWAIFVGWIIFACVNGYAEPINWFLSLSVWKIPSRISYSMYLIHMSIMYIHYASVLQPVTFSVGFYMFDFLAFFYISMFIAFFMTVLIDAPFGTLFRLLLVDGIRKRESPKTEIAKEDESAIKDNSVKEETNPQLSLTQQKGI